MNVGEVVREEIDRIAKQKGQDAEVRGEQSLVRELGFESLDLAELVAVLEIRLGVDPFATSARVGDVRTVGDLCTLYERCCSSGGPNVLA